MHKIKNNFEIFENVHFSTLLTWKMQISGVYYFFLNTPSKWGIFNGQRATHLPLIKAISICRQGQLEIYTLSMTTCKTFFQKGNVNEIKRVNFEVTRLIMNKTDTRKVFTSQSLRCLLRCFEITLLYVIRQRRHGSRVPRTKLRRSQRPRA